MSKSIEEIKEEGSIAFLSHKDSLYPKPHWSSLRARDSLEEKIRNLNPYPYDTQEWCAWLWEFEIALGVSVAG